MIHTTIIMLPCIACIIISVIVNLCSGLDLSKPFDMINQKHIRELEYYGFEDMLWMVQQIPKQPSTVYGICWNKICSGAMLSPTRFRIGSIIKPRPC